MNDRFECDSSNPLQFTKQPPICNGVYLFLMALATHRTVSSLHKSDGVQRMIIHPIDAASLYFAMSLENPAPLVWRPPVHTPPSTSKATRDSGHAKSNRHLRTSWKRYSGIGSVIRCVFSSCKNRYVLLTAITPNLVCSSTACVATSPSNKQPNACGLRAVSW